MPLVIRDLEQVIDQVVQRKFTLCGIEGAPKAGKSFLLSRLKKNPNLQCVDLDDYLVAHRGCYIEALRYADLKNNIRPSERTIIAGVCIREALKRMGLTLDFGVYVRAEDRNGRETPNYVQQLIDGETLSDVKNRWGLRETDLEYANYFVEHRPDSSSEIVYIRTSN